MPKNIRDIGVDGSGGGRTKGTTKWILVDMNATCVSFEIFQRAKQHWNSFPKSFHWNFTKNNTFPWFLGGFWGNFFTQFCPSGVTSPPYVRNPPSRISEHILVLRIRQPNRFLLLVSDDFRKSFREQMRNRWVPSRIQKKFFRFLGTRKLLSNVRSSHTVVKNIPVSVLVLLSLSVFLSFNSRQEHSQTSNRH